MNNSKVMQLFINYILMSFHSIWSIQNLFKTNRNKFSLNILFKVLSPDVSFDIVKIPWQLNSVNFNAILILMVFCLTLMILQVKIFNLFSIYPGKMNHSHTKMHLNYQCTSYFFTSWISFFSTMVEKKFLRTKSK